MMVLISYDVNTMDREGKARLRKVAKVCMNYGQRVQNSVFECLLNAAEYRIVKAQLEKIMDIKKDSIRFYNLGANYKERIEHMGVSELYDATGFLIL